MLVSDINIWNQDSLMSAKISVSFIYFTYISHIDPLNYKKISIIVDANISGNTKRSTQSVWNYLLICKLIGSVYKKNNWFKNMHNTG